MRMLLGLLKGLLPGALIGWALGYLKLEIAAIYVNAVDCSRRIFIAALAGLCLLMLCLSGFVLLHVALFLYLPWTLEDKICLLFGLGLAYFFLPVILFVGLSMRQTWLKATGAKDFAARALRDRQP